ncbi:glycosyltransferase 87 family protein [Propioniciclava flava]
MLLLWNRRWRAAAVASGTFALTVLLGFLVLPRDAVDFWTVALRDTRRIAPSEWIVNQSFDGVIARV